MLTVGTRRPQGEAGVWHNVPMGSLENTVKALAWELGFDLVGIASAQHMDDHRDIALHRVRRGCNPQELLPGARSIIAVGMSYLAPQDDGEARPGLHGTVARYSWGDDYHGVMKKRLKALVDELGSRLGRDIGARWYVDDGPMLDRAVAQRAGTGWFGKNTNILSPSHGSWVFLGQVLTDLELEPDAPLKKTCGSCVRCIDSCPTGAIVAPYVIDNARCISHLTIENRGPIPRELRAQMQDLVFGCDICQDVCPVNVKAAPSEEPAFISGRTTRLDLIELLKLTEEEFRERFRGSPIKRARRVGLQRNACVALGNAGDPLAVPDLAWVLSKGEPLVRGHVAWALARIGNSASLEALERARDLEEDPYVLEEIESALAASEAEPGPSGDQVSSQRA